jgi:hypothetical protein
MRCILMSFQIFIYSFIQFIYNKSTNFNAWNKPWSKNISLLLSNMLSLNKWILDYLILTFFI